MQGGVAAWRRGWSNGGNASANFRVGRAKAKRCPTSFPEARRINQVGVARPIRRIRPVFHEAVKARMGPVRHSGDVSIFDRIVVDAVAVALEIPLIADRVFPEPALPNPPFAFLLPSIRQPLPRHDGSGKRGFDQPPSRGVVRVVRWQSPQAMQVIGEDDDSVEVKRSLPPHGNKGGAQGVNVFRQQTTVAFQEGGREKVGTTGHIVADVMRHSGEFAPFAARSKGKP